MSRPRSAVIAMFVAEAIGMLLSGCQSPERTVSDGALRNATANGAAAELRAIGVRLRGRLTCRTPSGNTLKVVRVHCEGMTTDRRSVRVDGIARAADTPHPRQEFVIVVNGREVVRKSCLDLGCKHRP